MTSIEFHALAEAKHKTLYAEIQIASNGTLQTFRTGQKVCLRVRDVRKIIHAAYVIQRLGDSKVAQITGNRTVTRSRYSVVLQMEFNLM